MVWPVSNTEYAAFQKYMRILPSFDAMSVLIHWCHLPIMGLLHRIEMPSLNGLDGTLSICTSTFDTSCFGEIMLLSNTSWQRHSVIYCQSFHERNDKHLQINLVSLKKVCSVKDLLLWCCDVYILCVLCDVFDCSCPSNTQINNLKLSRWWKVFLLV
jgi:hypothetical protein